jgi:Na+/serine symporter
MNRIKVGLTGVLVSIVLAISAFAGPASAAQNQTGLVNVDVSNVLNNNTVTVRIPVAAAINLCGVSVDAAVLLAAAGSDQHVACVAQGASQG